METVDYFGFANTFDSFGIARNYPDARTEEMDDATLRHWANQIYKHYGYWTTIGSAAVIATLS